LISICLTKRINKRVFGYKWRSFYGGSPSKAVVMVGCGEILFKKWGGNGYGGNQIGVTGHMGIRLWKERCQRKRFRWGDLRAGNG